VRICSLVFVLVTLGLIALARPARAGDLEEFQLAKSRYDAGNYEQAAARFAVLLDPNEPTHLTDPKLRRLAGPLYAASLVALGRLEQADEVIADTLRADPSNMPTAGDFPQPVIDRFIKVRGEIAEELNAIQQARDQHKRQQELDRQRRRAAELARLAKLEQMASEERIVEERSRLVAMLPFGVGQFQNDDLGLGLFFAISEGVFAAGSVVSAIIAYDYAAVDCRTFVDPDTGAPADCAELQSSFELARTMNWISFSATMVLAAAGIIEAQASFEPERVEVRKRPLPPEVKVEPSATATESGAALGLTIRF